MKRFVTRFVKDKRGAVAIIAAVIAPVLFAVGGGAYDYGMVKMAWENSQHSADISATSAAGARRFEPWGKVLTGQDGSTQRINQQARVKALYGVNTRGYNFDKDFSPNITVTQEGSEEAPYLKTHVTGRSAVATGFVKLVGVDSLPYEIDTIVRHRVPGPKVTFDVTMFLDYTTSMRDGALAQQGESKISMLKAAAEKLVDWTMCGNDQGVDCDPNNDNRLSFIPYTTTSIGLDPCDILPGQTTSDGQTRPEYCDCEPPRLFPGGRDAWESEEARCWRHPGQDWPDCRPEHCRVECDRKDTQGRPATDPESEYFTCHCWKTNPDGSGKPLPPGPNEPVAGKYPCGMGDPKIWIDNEIDYPKQVSKKCIAFCPPGGSGEGCCNPCDKVPGMVKYSLDWAQCTMRHRFGCGCKQPLEIVDGPVTLTQLNPNTGNWETDSCPGPKCVRFGPQPEQTYRCHHQACTCSCSAAGGGIDPCAEVPKPPQCLPPVDPPAIPPPNPGLGYLDDLISQMQLASADLGEEGQMLSAVYRPDEDANAKLVLAQAGCSNPVDVADMAITLRECQQYGPGVGPGSCGEHIKNAMASDCYLENFGTNSSSAFIDFDKYMEFRPYLRPSMTDEANQPSLPQRMENVMVWISDGQNTRHTIHKPSGSVVEMPRPGLKTPTAYQQPGTSTNHGVDWDAFINNCYSETGDELKNPSNGTVVTACPGGNGTCGPNPQCPNGTKTARQWADEHTIRKCDNLRNTPSQYDQKKRMTIYSIFIAGENTSDDETKRVVNLMTRCAYGVERPDGSPPPGQEDMPQFFYVDDFETLRDAFGQITQTMDAIRISN